MLIGGRRVRGFTLIEVLVALFVFAIAILGLTQLYIRSYSTSIDLRQRAMVTAALQNLVARVRSNSEGVADYLGDHKSDLCTGRPPQCAQTASADASNCAASQMAQFDLWAALCGQGSDGDDSGGLGNRVIEWGVKISCTDAGEVCNEAGSSVRLEAQWTSRRADTDQRLDGDFSINVLDTGTTTVDTDKDQMTLEFSPW